TFSKSFHMMKYEENRHIIKIVHETLWADNVTGSAINLLHKWKLKSLFFPRQIRSTSHFDSFVYKAADDRLGSKGNETTKDFMYWFTDAVSQENGESFTMEELVEEGILLITAGSDTSSTAMAATIFYLLRTPHALERLQNEIRSVFRTVSSISFGPLLQSCTYLRACIDEGLRLAPPAGSVLHRQVEAGGVMVGSAFFPGNTDIGVPVFALHHDRTYFPDPFKFQPERWIVGETLIDGSKVTEAALRHSESAFMPFSAGTRGCIGKPLALLQMSIVFATLMLKYDLRLCKERWVNGLRSGIGPDPSEEFELVDTFISWKSGPLVEVRAREV
ncbi:cytochrome P450, partial [Macrophomina phaseolina]